MFTDKDNVIILGRYPRMLYSIGTVLKHCNIYMRTNMTPHYFIKAREDMYLQDSQGSWFNGIKRVFNVLNIKWTQIPPDKYQIRKITQKHKLSYEECWKTSMNKLSSTKVSMYNTIKSQFGYDQYLDIKCRRMRASMSVFRISAMSWKSPLVDTITHSCPGNTDIALSV